MAIDWRALARDRRLWAVGGIGGAAGLYVAYRRRGGAGSPASGMNQAAALGAGGPYATMQPSVYDSSLQDIYEGFNQTALDLQRQITELQGQMDRPAPPSSTTPPPPTRWPRPRPTPRPAPHPTPRPRPRRPAPPAPPRRRRP